MVICNGNKLSKCSRWNNRRELFALGTFNAGWCWLSWYVHNSHVWFLQDKGGYWCVMDKALIFPLADYDSDYNGVSTSRRHVERLLVRKPVEACFDASTGVQHRRKNHAAIDAFFNIKRNRPLNFKILVRFNWQLFMTNMLLIQRWRPCVFRVIYIWQMFARLFSNLAPIAKPFCW